MGKKYVLIFLFNETYEKLILMLRKKPPYSDCYNGIGGKINEGENAFKAAIRECQEEIHLVLSSLKPLYTIVYPVEEQGDESIDLHVFYQCVQDIELYSNDEGDYGWYPTSFALNFDNEQLAEGVPMFVKAILRKEGKI